MAIKDDIDRAKIGKRDEKLVGWDHIRKPKMNTNYPPMRARGAKDPYTRISLDMYSPHQSSGNWKWFWVVIFIVAVVGTKIIGLW